MTRHLAYVGELVSLQAALLDPQFGLAMSSTPHLQLDGLVNADGFGAGWYVTGRREPVRYRRAQPIWTDESFASLAPTIHTRCLLGSVRAGTPGSAHDESCVAPFLQGPWLFSHSGRLSDFRQARKALWEDTFDIPEAAAPIDSALMFGLAASRWTAGTPLGAALVEVIREVVRVGGGQLNLLAADGEGIAGTTYGEPLWVREAATGTYLASDPLDDHPDWQAVPEGALVEAGEHGLKITPLEL